MRTQAEMKIFVQFQKITQTEKFENAVREARESLGIPRNGFTPSDEDLEMLPSRFWIPTSFTPNDIEPEEFVLRCSDALRPIAAMMFLCGSYYYNLIRCYVFYNQFYFEELPQLGYWIRPTSLCTIFDDKAHIEELAPSNAYSAILSGYCDEVEYKEHARTDEDLMNEMSAYLYVDSMKQKVRDYPISIKIHPEASQRDVIDFIKANWQAISQLQEDHRDPVQPAVKYGRIKVNQKNQERNQLIYDNKDLPTNEIRHLLSERGWFLDDGHIRKIISLEKQKRERK